MDDSSLGTWLKKKTNKYASGDIQNEVLSVMANNILRTIVEKVKVDKFCSIMVDETPDVANKEQVVMCLRWVDSTLTAHEDFVGLYEVQSTQAIALFKAIQDVLLRLGISVNSANAMMMRHLCRVMCCDNVAKSGAQGNLHPLLWAFP